MGDGLRFFNLPTDPFLACCGRCGCGSPRGWSDLPLPLPALLNGGLLLPPATPVRISSSPPPPPPSSCSTRLTALEYPLLPTPPPPLVPLLDRARSPVDLAFAHDFEMDCFTILDAPLSGDGCLSGDAARGEEEVDADVGGDCCCCGCCA